MIQLTSAAAVLQDGSHLAIIVACELHRAYAVVMARTAQSLHAFAGVHRTQLGPDPYVQNPSMPHMMHPLV